MKTREQLLAMSREELIQADVRTTWPAVQTLPQAEYEQIVSKFDDPTDMWEQRLEQAFKEKTDVAELVSLFRTETPMVQIAVWSRVTRHGVERLDYAKFVHAHLAPVVLDIFGVAGP